MREISHELHEKALEVARKAIEDILVDFRDGRLSAINCGNGFVCREKDGKPSDIIRLSTKQGLSIAINEYLKVIEQAG